MFFAFWEVPKQIVKRLWLWSDLLDTLSSPVYECAATFPGQKNLGVAPSRFRSRPHPVRQVCSTAHTNPLQPSYCMLTPWLTTPTFPRTTLNSTPLSHHHKPMNLLRNIGSGVSGEIINYSEQQRHAAKHQTMPQKGQQSAPVCCVLPVAA